MSLLSSLTGRLLDGVDIGFNACATILRVARRGAFAPDAESYRASRYARLNAADVLVQEISLNANDANEAKRAVALDPERNLPLAPDTLVFDVAGPLPSEQLSPRPERQFLLGAVRKDALSNLRAEQPLGRRGAIEVFVFVPQALANAVLVFEDDSGRAKRRTRRAATAAALALCLYAGNELMVSADAAFDRLNTAAETERAVVNRRIRAAERRASDATAALAALQQAPRRHLGDVAHALALLARTLPADAKIDGVSIDGGAITIDGAAYSPEAAELALRRSFEGNRIGFSAQSGDAPVTYHADLREPPRS